MFSLKTKSGQSFCKEICPRNNITTCTWKTSSEELEDQFGPNSKYFSTRKLTQRQPQYLDAQAGESYGQAEASTPLPSALCLLMLCVDLPWIRKLRGKSI